MTLGRTSSGAIKIKTDGGLRAVNCACCVGLGCQITEAQFNAIRYGFTTNISGTQGIGTQVAVAQAYEYSYQNQTEARLEILGAVDSVGFQFFVVSTTGPLTCIVNGPPGSGVTYPVPYDNVNRESLSVYMFYTAWIPDDTNIPPTYFLTANNAVQYERTEMECPNDGNPPVPVVQESKTSLDLCGAELYKLVLEGGAWAPQP